MMPGGDRTGPMGLGSKTGRAAGYCARNQVPGYMNQNFGRFFCRPGRGRRNLFFAADLPGWQPGALGYTPVVQTMTEEQELAELKNEAEYLENKLEDVKKRIQEIEE